MKKVLSKTDRIYELNRLINESASLRDIIADQLTNVADEGGFANAKDFAKTIGKIGGGKLSPKVAEKIYNDFMSKSPMERMKLARNTEMHKFLAKYGIK